MSDLDVIESLPSLDNYTSRDRYNDFRKVFSTDEGRRVLKELLSWGRMFRPSVFGSPVDPYLTHIREGERNFALRLLSTYSTDPPEQKDRQAR